MNAELRFFDADNSVLDDLEAIHKFKPYNNNTLEMIAENYLWFAALDSLNDPFEGSLTYKIDTNLDINSVFCAEHIFFNDEKNVDYGHPAIKHEYAEYQIDPVGVIESKIKEHIQKYECVMLRNSKTDGFFCALSVPKNDKAVVDASIASEQYRIDSIHRNHQDISLWSHYGDGLRGVKITYDPLKLKQLKCISSSFVRYQDDPELIDATAHVRKWKAYYKERWINSQSLTMFTTKATLWSHEREIRIRTFTQGKVKIQPNSIKSITFGSKLPADKRLLIIAAARQNNPDAKFYVATISNKEFKIEYIEYEIPTLINP